MRVSGEQRERKSSPTFTRWLADAFGLLVAAVTVVGAFVTVTPIEIDTLAELFAVVLFVVAVTCAGALMWGRRHHGHGWRPTALLAVLAVFALAGGLLLAVSAASSPPTVSGSPTPGTLAPATTSSGTDQAHPGPDGSGLGAGGGGLTPKPIGDGQVIPPNTGRSTTAVPSPMPRTTQSTDTPVPATDAVRYQGEFRLSASQESVDLDLNPPQAYGPANELAVDDHAIWTVPPYTKGVAVGKSPTRAQCVEAADRANPPADYFDDPQPGDMFCVRTSDSRYALVRVVSSATKDFTLALTVWK